MKRFILITCSFLLSAAFANEIQRCEAPNGGGVTYSNENCPPGTKPVRKIDTRPTIIDLSNLSRPQRESKVTEDKQALEKAESESLTRARVAGRAKENQLDQECNQLRIIVNKAKEVLLHAEADTQETLENNLAQAQENFERTCPGRTVE